MSLTSNNMSFYAIPAMWVLSISPHLYAVNLVKANKEKLGVTDWDNSNPKSTMSIIAQGKTPLHRKIQRAEAAQENGFANIGLLAATVVAANYANLPTSKINTLTGLYILARALFNLAYINISDNKTSNLRSALYLTSIGTLMTIWIQSGNILYKSVL